MEWLIPLGFVIIVLFGTWLDTKIDPKLGKDRSSHRTGRREDDCV